VIKLPILRKILEVGCSKCISLPKSWLSDAEEKAGKKIVMIAMEVNGKLILQPVFEKSKGG